MPRSGSGCTWRSRSATSSRHSPRSGAAGLLRMCPDDVGDLRCRRLWTDDGSRSGAECREDGGRDRGVALVAGMEPVGPAEITRPAVLAVEFIDSVETIQADERPMMPLTHLLDDGVHAGGWQPAADAEHARLDRKSTRL